MMIELRHMTLVDAHFTLLCHSSSVLNRKMKREPLALDVMGRRTSWSLYVNT